MLFQDDTEAGIEDGELHYYTNEIKSHKNEAIF